MNNIDPQIVEARRIKIERVNDQYEQRILLLLKGKKADELNKSEKAIYDKLVRCAMYDPRRYDVGFTNKDMVYRGIEIAKKLDKLTDDEFMEDQYVLGWIDELGEDGMKINNLPIDE